MTTYRENLSEVDFHRLSKSEVPYSRKSNAGNGLRKSEVVFSEVRKCGANELENLGKLSEVKTPLKGDAATSAAVPFSAWAGSRPDFIRNGQPYWRSGHRGHTTRDGRHIVLDVWTTFCAACGDPTYVTSLPNADPESRRCDAHKAPGRKVGGRRKHP